jgi:phosphate-selective porin OprO/OprP
MERSYADQLSPAKKMGAQFHGELTGVTYSGGVFQMNDSALSQKDHNLSSAGRISANFAELMGNKDMVMHVGLAGYNSNYEMTTATSSNTSGSAEVVNRGTVFGFTSGGRGLANAYRMQIAGVEAGTLVPGDDNTSTCSVSGSGTTSVPTYTTNTAGVITGLTGSTEVRTISITGSATSCGSNVTNAGYNVVAPTTSSVHTDRFGLEGILAWNNFKLQGEYSDASYKASSKYATGSTSATGDISEIKANVKTWYAEGLWILTGEKYADSYKKGAFGGLKPKNEFNMDKGTGYGLWELGFRVDAFDVADTSSTGSSSNRFQGTTQTVGNYSTSKIDECNNPASGGTCNGGATSYTAGVKWVMNPNMLIKANYTFTDFDNAFYPIDIGTKGTGGRTASNLEKISHENLFMVRGQYAF